MTVDNTVGWDRRFGGGGGTFIWSYSMIMLKIHQKGAKNQSRVAEADSDFQYDVEAAYCFLEV